MLGNRRGFTLLSVLVTIALTAVAMLGVQKLLSLTFQGGAHADLKSGVRMLSDSLKRNVNCAETFRGVDLDKACSTTPLAIQLKDRQGAPLTSLPQAGPFSPTDNGLNGAGRIGNWHVRAYCDSVSRELIIRYSKVSSDRGLAGAGFASDPLTKRDYDWRDSSTNPLFGTPDRSLCRARTGTGNTANHVVTAPMAPLPLGHPMRDCTPSFTKNGKLYLLAAGGAAYTVLMPDSVLIQATVQCPTGQIAVGGGAQCGVGVSLASGVAGLAGAGHAPGYLSVSQPTEDGTGWSTACCVEGTPTRTAQAYAICLPSEN